AVERVAHAGVRRVQRQPANRGAELVAVPAGDARLREPRPADRHSARRDRGTPGHRPHGARDRARRARSDPGQLLMPLMPRPSGARSAGALQPGDALAQPRDAPRRVLAMQDSLAGSFAEVPHRLAQLGLGGGQVLSGHRLADLAHIGLDARADDPVAVVALLVLAIALDRRLVTIGQRRSSSVKPKPVPRTPRWVNDANAGVA